MHIAEWALHDQAVSRCCSAGLRAASSCQHCGLQVSQPSRHHKHCTVLYQASLASLILAQASQNGQREGGGSPSHSGSRGDAAGTRGYSPAEPEHHSGTKRGRPGGRPGPHAGSSTAQTAEASFQEWQRRLTGWLVPRQLGPEAPVGANGHGRSGAADGAGPSHSGCDAEHGEGGATARGRDPEDQNRCRLHGLHRYFGVGHPSPASIHGRELVPEVRPGHGHDTIAARPLSLHAGDPEDEGRGGVARRGSPSALHERGVDGSGSHGAQPGLGVSHLGLCGKMPDQGGHPSSATLRGNEDDRPAAPALPEGRCPQELQDPSQDVAEGSVQGGGPPFHGLNRAPGESCKICFDALRVLSGLAITKLIGVRIRPERGQESQLIKQLKESYMGTSYCDWGAQDSPWKNSSRLANPYQLHDSGDCGAPLLLNLSGGDLVAIPVFTEATDLCTRLVPSNSSAMNVALYALPDHMQLVALEESLLLKALRNGADDASAIRPCFTLFARNELVYVAMQMLSGDSLRHFLEYADMLARSNIMEVLVNVPEPDDEPDPRSSRAEVLAYHYLQEGRCALWTAVRSVARDLPFDEDPRSFTNGQTLRLGLYNKGGLTGLSGATKLHRSTCRLLNFILYTCSRSAMGKARALLKDIAICSAMASMGADAAASAGAQAAGSTFSDAAGLRIQLSLEGALGCDRAAGSGHTHCCSLCADTGGDQHMLACTMRQQHVRMTGPGGSRGGDQAPADPAGVRSEPSPMEVDSSSEEADFEIIREDPHTHSPDMAGGIGGATADANTVLESTANPPPAGLDLHSMD
ncbi:unnamed protein product [Symbiodinium necroappetens]|uniref:Uncharacterized protein n=1 Tax=Symbiodinium necroappetens TaxID=1628268 RepID=A0A812WXR6_9DINO|nr:unnamed protein product [Symbiodinium necroappetens]